MGWVDKLRGKVRRPDGSFLSQLARDRAGNTLAIMAAAMIPLIGFSGSAIDMARLYVVKVRLQQACDAGALAGRKSMTDTNPLTPLDAAASTQAQQFFANNFHSGWFQNTAASFTPTKATEAPSIVANAVHGTATSTVPMALMQYFGAPAVTLNVSCQARYELADTDVMFVLDTTGSMSCYPTDPTDCGTPTASYTRGDGTTGYNNPQKPQTTDSNGNPLYSKIESLRQAVLTFDTTMRSSADPSTHFRYGFVTYSSAVNVGAIIPSGYLQNTNWTYQSRHLSPAIGNGGSIAGDYAYGSSSSFSLTGIPKTTCVDQRYPATGFSRTGPTWSDAGYYQAMHYYNLTWTGTNGGTCSGSAQPLRAYWRYEPVSWNIAQYAAGNTSVTNPTRLDGSTSAKWRGCIEELNTSAVASFDVNNLPDDLNPDVIPTSAADKWRPIWPDVEWLRQPGTANQDMQDDLVNETNISRWTDYNYRPGGQLDQGGSGACGMPAQRLNTMTAQQVHDYVYNTDFVPFGGTYHDVGMIWGTRMLSPTSVFADSQPWPGHNPPNRTIVFMTDGTMSPSEYSYGQYGVEALDNRIGSGGSSTEQYNRHVARFRVECDAAKKKGFTIYTVGVGLNGTPVPDLDYCSTEGKTYFANDSTTLVAVFKSIAQKVAKLRITQ